MTVAKLSSNGPMNVASDTLVLLAEWTYSDRALFLQRVHHWMSYGSLPPPFTRADAENRSAAVEVVKCPFAAD